MNLFFHSPMRSLALFGLTLFSAASPAWAVFPFSWVTNGSGLVTDGSWAGNGTVQNNLNPASTAAQIAVQNFSSGAIGMAIGGTIYAANVGALNDNQRVLQKPIGVTQTISLTGGTADLRLHNSNSFDGGSALFNSVGLTDFQGVTSVSWTVTFDTPIAGRNFKPTNLDLAAMGGALALITEGSGQTISSFTVGLSYPLIYHENALNTGFNMGVPITATPRQSEGFGTAVAGATSFTSNAFSSLNDFLLVRGYDVDGGGYGTTDNPEVYIRQMTWTIARDDNAAFAADTLFVVSMDGAQYGNYLNVIPEPTNVMLLAGSLLGGCLLRRRRA